MVSISRTQSKVDIDLYPRITKESEDAGALSSLCILEQRLEPKDKNRDYDFLMPTQGTTVSIHWTWTTSS